jgi:hypothetical protein
MTIAKAKPKPIRFRHRKGRCYEIAYRTLVNGDMPGTWHLMHGTGLNPHGGERIGHAWLENETHAFDPVLNATQEKAGYHVLYHVVVVARFDLLQACENVIAHKHYGPW